MNVLEPDRNQLEIFVDALFRHAGNEGFVSLRAFYEDDASKPFRISPTSLRGGLKFLIDVAEDDARRAANVGKGVVFCPPLAVFSNKDRAREQDILAGLVLSVECDQRPREAILKLKEILGPPTLVVRSGGKWTNPDTGKIYGKRHGHWRLCRPARGADLVRLKQARDLAARLVGGDPSNKSVCHPIRWPGSWHRKAEPTLCKIEIATPDSEIDLDAALAALIAAAPPEAIKPKSNGTGAEQTIDWRELVQGILTGENYHGALVQLAAKMLTSGMSDGAAVNMLRGLMESSAGPHDGRWATRYADIPRAVSTAREKYGARQKTQRQQNGLPELDLDADPVAVARELAALIAQRRDILLNGYTPVRVVHEQGQDPHAVELSPEAVRTYAYEICRCVKTVKDKIVETPLGNDIAKLYLNGLEGQWGLRPLRGISTSPLLSADGGLRSANGYDEETGLWCHSVPAVLVPDQPTKDDAQRALLVLRQAFWTFPFEDAQTVFDGTLEVNVVDLSQPPRLDESTHLAALMTSVCRPCLSLAPGFLYDAPQYSGAGTGKGLLVKSACIVGSGSAPSAMTAGHDQDELDKRLTAAAIEARPAIYLDNFNRGTLESATLASFLTEDPARVRVLGQSKTVPLNTRAFVAITGNAVQIAEDIARRVLKICIDAKMEDPEQRPFAPGFLRGIFTRRISLLSACLTIWRWGVQRGDQLQHGRPLGSYEQWSRWCRDPLLALGCRDPIERVAKIKSTDPKRRHLIEVFEQWWKNHSDQQVTAGDLHLDVKESIDTNSKRVGVGNDELVFSRQRVTSFLRSHTGSRVGGFHLEQMPETRNKQHNIVATYRLSQTSTK
jgi:hypothetical protein